MVGSQSDTTASWRIQIRSRAMESKTCGECRYRVSNRICRPPIKTRILTTISPYGECPYYGTPKEAKVEIPNWSGDDAVDSGPVPDEV